MLQLTINRTSWVTFRDALASLAPFKTHGNLSGMAGCLRYDAGQLPEPHRSEYLDRRNFIDYTVLSYATPIAWHDTERGWIMPDVRYSTTTSKAQGRIAPAVHALNSAVVKTDKRGVEYRENVRDYDALPDGWALCGGCNRAWNDDKPTSVTPAPSGRCPFEYEHEYTD